MTEHRLILQHALMPEGWQSNVALTLDGDGVITAIGEGAKKESSKSESISGLCLPGLPNLHSHAFQRGFSGLTERAGASADSFWTWREAMYRFVGALTPEDNEAIAALAYAEMLENGFTSVAEFHYLHHDADGAPYHNLAEMGERIAAAAGDTGIGLTLLPVFYAHSDFLGAPPTYGQRRFVNELEAYLLLLEMSKKAVNGLPHGRLGIAPHSLRAATLAEITILLEEQVSGPVHIHISEQLKEVDDCLQAHGARPIELLCHNVTVDERWCFIHATHATLTERNLMREAGVIAGLCPLTEANLGDGLFAAADYYHQGGGYGVGSDSNVEITAFGELKMLEYGQRLSLRRRNALTPRGASTGASLYQAALAGGAQALGMPVAGFVIGARADIVALDPDNLMLMARDRDAMLDSAIFSGPHNAVQTVYVGGRKVVDGGRHLNRPAIEARFRNVLNRLSS